VLLERSTPEGFDDPGRRAVHLDGDAGARARRLVVRVAPMRQSGLVLLQRLHALLVAALLGSRANIGNEPIGGKLPLSGQVGSPLALVLVATTLLGEERPLAPVRLELSERAGEKIAGVYARGHRFLMGRMLD
jgi:hypothetical protein